MSLTKVTYSMIDGAPINVRDFGAVGDGVTDDSSAIQAAINQGGKIVFPTGVYRCENIGSYEDVNIDFCGSTIKRVTGNTRMFVFFTGNATLQNGTIDGENIGDAFQFLVDYQNSNGDFVVDNMVFINNCKFDAVDEPTKSQNTDLVYVKSAKSATITNSKFLLCSRNGISFTEPCAEIKLIGNTFEDCYLFGVDIEPNVSTTSMYANVVISGNSFINCGAKSPTNSVWPANANGPFAILSAASSILIVQNVVFSDNTVVSDEAVRGVPGFIEPQIRIEQFRSMSFTGNAIDQIDLIRFCIDQTTNSESAVFTGNSFTPNLFEGNIFAGSKLNNLTFSGNNAKLLNIASLTATVSNNIFDNQIVVQATNTSAVIDGNTFKSSAYGIDTSLNNENLIITNNKQIGGLGLYNNPLDATSIAAGNSDGIVLARRFAASTSEIIAIPTATPTVVLSLADRDSIGLIAVYDEGGTRIGSYANFANFYDGSNNTSFLTGVQNSGISGSALTLSGNDIVFTHTFGSTRNLKVNVLYTGGN